jgi:hypothetical protein
MPPVGFEPMILVSERPHIHALDRTATGIGILPFYAICTETLTVSLDRNREHEKITDLALPAASSMNHEPIESKT